MEKNGNGKRHFQQSGKVDFQMKKLNVSNGDIVVIRVPRDDLPGRIRENLLVQLRQAFPKNELLMVGSNVNLNVLPKRTLNAMGWFKENQPKNPEAQGFTNVEDELMKIEVKNFAKEQTQLFAVALSKRLTKELPDVKLDVRVETYIKKR